VIRPARPEECDALTELAIRSKAHWGYDAPFLARCRDGELRVTPATLAPGLAFVLEAEGAPVGFYALDGGVPVADLAFLFVEPHALGRGVGARLLAHAVEQARTRGCEAITIASDPFAEGFYLARGAVRVGEVESTVMPGRMLPTLRLAIDG
jgi:GNAT superfamily N-acetyltransferase